MSDNFSQNLNPNETEIKNQALLKLKNQCQACTKCSLAFLGRAQTVFGEGNINTKIMLIGEGPGKNEDLLGHVFIGRSGNLLTKMIESIGLKRSDIYISNVVKCRPPKNRTPLKEENNTCKNLFLLKEIAIINPLIICTLGASATKAILGEKVEITKIHGIFHKHNHHLVIPTYHPAYILRNPTKKKCFLEDIQKILDAIK